MKIDKETMIKAIERGICSHATEAQQGRFGAKEIVQILERLHEIHEERRAIDMEIINEEERRQDFERQIQERKANLVKRCSHPNHKYHPDPAGGTDSHHSCDLCGGQW
jgi:hypothetical protein